MRLFAALPLPDAAVERLTSLRLRLSAPKDGLRWSEPEQWHITLQFYGDVDPDTAACLQSRLVRIACPPPDVVLGELGQFAAKGILFATIQPSASLAKLHAYVLEQGGHCGVVPESRPFRPHITLARSKGKSGHGTLQRISTPALPAFGSEIRWAARECLLLESTLGPLGAQYSVRARMAIGDEAESQGGGR